MDSYDDQSVLLELAAYNEEDRTAFLNELAEVTWVYRALENDRIGTLGVSDKMGQSTLSLHVSFENKANDHYFVVRILLPLCYVTVDGLQEISSLPEIESYIHHTVNKSKGLGRVN